MKDIAIYGAGGFGREVACLIKIINKKKLIWNFLGFFDDIKEIGDSNEYGKVIGGMEEMNKWNKPLNVVFAIGSPQKLLNLVSLVTNPLLEFPNIIAPGAIFLDEENVRIGKGNIFCIGCIISCNVTIGDFNIMISMTTIGHDVVIGDGNVFMPSSKISGQVHVGNGNIFGLASTVLQKVQIGNNTTIGANSLIIRKTKDNMTYIGSPATVLNY